MALMAVRLKLLVNRLVWLRVRLTHVVSIPLSSVHLGRELELPRLGCNLVEGVPLTDEIGTTMLLPSGMLAPLLLPFMTPSLLTLMFVVVVPPC